MGGRERDRLFDEGRRRDRGRHVRRETGNIESEVNKRATVKPSKPFFFALTTNVAAVMLPPEVFGRA